MHLRLSQFTNVIFSTFISIDNQGSKSVQCDWGFTEVPSNTVEYGQTNDL